MKKTYYQPTITVNAFEFESFLLSGSSTPVVTPPVLGPGYATDMQF